MNRNVGGSNPPGEMHTKEPVNTAHEVNLVTGAQETAEESLHSRIFVEVNKIVNIEPEREEQTMKPW